MNAKRKPLAARVPLPTEYELHCQVVKFLNHALDGNSTFFHPANGGYRHATEAKKLKAMAVMPGLPDLGLIVDGRIIWLEIKRAKGSYLSPAQHYCHEQLRRARSPVYVIRSLDDLEAALASAGIPVKARVVL
jgi:hypothetical protein